MDAASRSHPVDVLFVDHFLENYLSKLVIKPCSPQILQKIPQFCIAAKNVGKIMDVNPNKEKFDRMQMIFNEFCKDVGVDVALRLQVLEVLELRIMKWNVRPELAEYYQSNIAKIEENRKMKQAQATKDNSSIKSSSTISTVFLEKSNRQKSYPVGDEMRFKTSVQELFPEVKLKERECVVVDGVKIFLSSVSTDLLKKAKTILTEHLVKPKPASSSLIRYSREDLLSLAAAPFSQDENKFTFIRHSCPEVLLKD